VCFFVWSYVHVCVCHSVCLHAFLRVEVGVSDSVAEFFEVAPLFSLYMFVISSVFVYVCV